MRYVFLFLAAFLLLAACTPQPPTGRAIAPPSHWEDGNREFLSVSVAEQPLASERAVSVSVKGDLVLDRVLLDGEERSLAGRRRAGEWLSESGSTVLYLEPGQYELWAYSCQESFSGWKCGCVAADDCGHWMKRAVRVK